MRNVRAFPLILGTIVAAVGCAAGPSVAETDTVVSKTISASAFVDSIGFNTHFSYGGTAYTADEPRVVDAIVALHVRHLREGMLYPYGAQFPTYRQAVATLAKDGVRTLAGVQASDIVRPDFGARWKSWFDSVGGTNWVEATEPPNECDLNGCLASVAAYQKILFDTVKGYAPSRSVVVLGPSLTTPTAYARVGNLANELDAGNGHFYMLSQPPETTAICQISDACHGGATVGSTIGNTYSLPALLAAARPVSGPKPIVNSEAGYCTTVAANGNTRYNDVPRSVQASYWPRYLLHAFGDLGIGRTYIYDIADDGLSPPTFDRCGLLDATAAPKPSYRILKTLLDAVDDPGPVVAARPLAFSVRAAANVDGAPVEAMALGSRGGAYSIVVWNPVSTFYQQSGNGGDVSHEIAVAPIAGSLSIGNPFASATLTVFDPRTGDAKKTAVDPRKPIALSITPTITMVTLRP